MITKELVAVNIAVGSIFAISFGALVCFFILKVWIPPKEKPKARCIPNRLLEGDPWAAAFPIQRHQIKEQPAGDRYFFCPADNGPRRIWPHELPEPEGLFARNWDRIAWGLGFRHIVKYVDEEGQEQPPPQTGPPPLALPQP